MFCIFLLFSVLLCPLFVQSDNNVIQGESTESPSKEQQQCREHFTCLSPDRTIENLQYLKTNSRLPNWYEMCNCDAHCHIFGDCCSDAPSIINFNTEDWSFVKIRFGKTQFMSLLRSKCSSKWNDTVIREKCEYNRHASYLEYFMPEIEHLMFITPNDEFLNWHVTGRESLITYKNIYCAKCNYEEKVEAWLQKLRCRASTSIHSSSSTNQDQVFDSKDYTHKCAIVSYPQTPDIIVKEKLMRFPLQTKVWSQCALGWYKLNLLKNTNNVLDTIKRCLIFYEPVVVQELGKYMIFKNRYCAQCNDYNENHFECPQKSIDQTTQIPANFKVIESFDTNTTRGSQINTFSNITCPPDSVFNPLIRNCQDMHKVLSIKDRTNFSSILDRPSYASSVGLQPNHSNVCSAQKILLLTFFSLFLITLICT